jgi:CelD/BcsL family acetyltransferase involved in cellulose biosynthesis
VSGARRGERIRFTIETLPPLSDLATEWQSLELGANGSFFTSWWWIGTWLETIASLCTPRLLRGTASGRTVAIAAIAERRALRHRIIASDAIYLNQTGDPALDAIFIEHNGVLADPVVQDRVDRDLMQWFAEGGSPANELHLAGTTRPLDAAFLGDALLISVSTTPSFSVDLSLLAASEGDNTILLSSNARQQLRRSLRDCAAIGELGIDRAADADTALAYFANLKRWHIASWQRRRRQHAFATPHFEEFHRRLIVQALASGSIEMLRVTSGGVPIGYLYNFRHRDRIYAYQSGFDPDAAARRPGFVSHHLAIREAWRSGARVYDFLAGGNRLKESFATNRDDMYWSILQRPLVRFRLERAVRRVRASVAARLAAPKAR